MFRGWYTQPMPTPTPPGQGDDPAALAALVRDCRGNLSEVARRLSAQGERPIRRQALTRRLERLGLAALATELAVAAGVSGRRRQDATQLGAARDADRLRMLDALVGAPKYDAAAKALGLPRRTFYNRLRRYSITADAVEQHRRRSTRKPRRRTSIATH